MGLTMKEKQAVVREYRPRYQKASKKEKPHQTHHVTEKPHPDTHLLLRGGA
ncbi:MAG: hypothetical protein LBG24_02855 [Treponema sp.]|jgi:hypothetical protein|nr:hypothetical protein [Treponema sp.]